MKVCFNRVRKICPVENCYIEYGTKGNCPRDLVYTEEEISDVTLIQSKIERVLNKDMKTN